jgi:putative ABC transport system permease protein
MLTLFGYVLKNLGRQKLRTALAAVGMMVGVWLVVIFSAISAGALQTVESMLTAFGEDFHVYKAGIADMALSTLPERESRESILSADGVRDVSGALGWISTTEGVPLIYIVGLRPGEFALENIIKNGEGGFSGPDAHEAILGGLIMDRLGKKIGDTVEFEGKSYDVVGRFMKGMPLYDNAVIIPLDIVQSEFRKGENVVNFFAVRAMAGRDRVRVAKSVEEADPSLATVSTLEEVSKVDQGLKKMKTVSLVILFAAVFIGFLFVMLAMVMVIFERIREIGILRAVGWKRRQIVTAVLIESLLLSLIGVVAAIPTGLIGVEIISHVTELKSFLAPVYTPTLYIRCFVVAIGAATIGGIYPAWRAARLRPAEAIRYE